ncbi:SDR family oxidoreductase, partial [Nocardioides sp.]|uniref:SDR family oxidoreductase n=1 Tax=Nocardioides sp. TaxID=35761 RepID=UPI002B275DCE
MRGLQGKVAIVTGASRGIGLGIAERLVAEGAKVVITARKPEALAEAVESLGGSEHALGVPGNAGDAAHRADVVAAAIEAFGSVDLLVNNTGINPAFGPLMELDLDAARKIMDVNVVAALGFTQEAFRGWMKEHGGSVVNISSLSGVRPAPYISMYGASKAAMISLTETLAEELGPRIRVNAVAPAVVKTKFAEALYVGREEEDR